MLFRSLEKSLTLKVRYIFSFCCEVTILEIRGFDLTTAIRSYTLGDISLVASVVKLDKTSDTHHVLAHGLRWSRGENTVKMRFLGEVSL